MKTSPSKCPFGYDKAIAGLEKPKADVTFYDNDRYLVSFSEVGKDYNHDVLNFYRKQISDINNYLYDFISQENQELGRTGIVCPYTPGALQKGNLFFTVYEKNLSNKLESKKLVLDYMNLFLKIEPTFGKSKIFKSIVIILPEVSSEYSEEVIERVQNELKPYFVKNGLMIGQFYPGCNSPGMHNSEFKPLRSPIPMLIIRYMVKTDYVFLDNYQQEYFDNFKEDSDPTAKKYFARLNYGKSA